MTKEYILKKEDFKGKLIKIPNNISRKKFNKIIKKLERIGYSKTGCFVCYDTINFSSILDINSILTFSLCNDIRYLNHSEDGTCCAEEVCEEISIKDFLAEPKKDNICRLEIATDSLMEQENKLKKGFNSLEDFISYLLDYGYLIKENLNTTVKFSVSSKNLQKLKEIKSGTSIWGKYYIKEIDFFCSAKKGIDVSVKFIKVSEYEKSKIKIHDLFIEIEGDRGINKYNIDKICPDDARGEIRLAIIHNDPNKSIWLYYKTKSTRDKDFQKLLKLKDNT